MIKFYIPTHLLSRLSEETLVDIAELSVGVANYEVVEEVRGRNTGQYIKLQNDNQIKYICLSGEDSTVSRNSFILQNFPTAYQHFLMDESENKNFEYYIRDTKNPHPPYTIFAYKVLLTAKIKILNLDKVVPSANANYLDHRTPFLDFKQMRKYRLESQGRNSGNNSTLFEETVDEILEDGENYITRRREISVYGKSYGANGRETTAICLALRELVDLPIKVYNVNETDPAHLAKVDLANKYIFDYYGIEVDSESIDFESTDEKVIAKRNTKKYHYNLLQKFQEKKCYLCRCGIENLIIGSHIHRVTDIIHSDLSETEKQKMIVDEDNGFWLCANHDKMFEYGLIYFDDDEMEIKETLSTEQKEYLIDSTFYLKEVYEAFINNS